MALPPEPLAEVLPLVHLIIDGEVQQCEQTSPDVAPVRHGGVFLAGTQQVQLRCDAVLWRSTTVPPPPPLLTVEKPAAGYAVRVGTHGPFLLAQQPSGWVMMGRYGPDTYEREALLAAIKDL
jgi:hypothetical protein